MIRFSETSNQDSHIVNIVLQIVRILQHVKICIECLLVDSFSKISLDLLKTVAW